MEVIAVVFMFGLVMGVVIGRLMRNEEKDLELTEKQNQCAQLLIENDKLRDELQQSEDALVESLRRQINYQLEAA